MQHTDVESLIVSTLAALGWTPEDGTAIARKGYRTAVGRKEALVYLSPGDEYNRTLSGDYQSQGGNILAICSRLLPHGISQEEVQAITTDFAKSAEAAIADSYAVRLLKPD